MTIHVYFLILTIYWAIAGLQTLAITDVFEVQTLQDLYRSLNSPVQLKHWKAETGDPCEEIWMGVQCSGSSLITLDLHGLELTGNLRSQLSNLKRLKHLIVADNKFSGIIPYSIVKMKHLCHLNLSHNLLSGSLGDVFYGLENLKEMDLSFNYFTGSLPTSFRSLTTLTGLFLQNNQFTGSVIYLANLSLTDLNIEDNYFSGLIPESFQYIINLKIAGNKFVTETNYEPSKFPKEKHISRISTANAITIGNHPSQSVVHKNRKLTIQIVIMIGAFTLAAAFSVPLTLALRQRPLKRHRSSGNPDEPVSPDESVRSSSPDGNLDYTSTSGERSPNTSSFSSPSSSTSSSRQPISRSGMPTGLRVYSAEELQIATNRFSRENFIGEGSLGCSVFRAEFADGTVVAVKNIKVPSYITGVQQRLLVIKNIFSLKHPNIVRLIGYSNDQDQLLLVYEFFRNLSLDKALQPLHSDEHKPLSYRERLQIALGVARALEYMHSSCVPPISYSNFKAENILLNEDLEPLFSDCDLAIFSNTNSPGNTKADVHTFGELFLELLTGSKPFDSAGPRQKQHLVKWASSMLQDCVFFEYMVDPDIERQIPSSLLSHIADIVSLLIKLLHNQAAESRVIQFPYKVLCDATKNFDKYCLIDDSIFWRIHMGTFEEGQMLLRTHHHCSGAREFPLPSKLLEECKRWWVTFGWPVPFTCSILSILTPPQDSPPLQWSSRISIALQVARGMQTMVGDVWMARTFYMLDPEHSHTESYLPVDDPYFRYVEGYVPPMCIYPWSCDKDVYSFGILLLVLITGKKAYDDETSGSFLNDLLIDRVRHILKGDEELPLSLLLDKAIEADSVTLGMAADLVCKCTMEHEDSRPEISEVVTILEFIMWLICFGFGI